MIELYFTLVEPEMEIEEDAESTTSAETEVVEVGFKEKCTLCDFVSHSKITTNKHLKKEHDYFECGKCEQVMTKEKYFPHLEEHAKDEDFDFTLVSMSNVSRYDLRKR